MTHVPDCARWHVIGLAARTSPGRVARRLGIDTSDVARICAGFTVRRTIARIVSGDYALTAHT